MSHHDKRYRSEEISPIVTKYSPSTQKSAPLTVTTFGPPMNPEPPVLRSPDGWDATVIGEKKIFLEMNATVKKVKKSLIGTLTKVDIPWVVLLVVHVHIANCWVPKCFKPV